MYLHYQIFVTIALHSIKSMGESIDTMEEKIQDKKVEGIENSRHVPPFFFIFPPKTSPVYCDIFLHILIFISRFWIEKSRKDAQLMTKLKMSSGENQDLNEIEQSLVREQTRSMDLDEKEERLVLRQRLANRTKW